jgi:transcriptional regulator with XRE-family HTH domain
MHSSTETVKTPKRDKPVTHHPERLKWRRFAAGLNGPQLAAKAGYTKQHISKLERGEINASAECLARLAEALGCQVTDLMPDEPQGIAS